MHLKYFMNKGKVQKGQNTAYGSLHHLMPKAIFKLAIDTFLFFLHLCEKTCTVLRFESFLDMEEYIYIYIYMVFTINTTVDAHNYFD